jgi:hypothetical protein
LSQLVERANGYPTTSFLPGRHFSGPDDFNRRLASHWACARAPVRTGAEGCHPAFVVIGAVDMSGVCGSPAPVDHSQWVRRAVWAVSSANSASS